MKRVSRRDFVKFIGGAALLPTALSLYSCQESVLKYGIKPSSVDDLIIDSNLKYDVLLKWGDSFGTGIVSDTFGYNNDYTAFFKLSDNRALLWVNHEYPSPMFISGWTKGVKRTKAQVEKEMYNVGGSIVEIKKSSNKWSLVLDSKYNRRLSALTKIPFANNISVNGSSHAIGTLGNCAGGVTPWQSVLTCEENYDVYYGEELHNETRSKGRLGWDEFFDYHPHHYGWVVEVNPKTGEAKKHTSLGRFAHECCTVTQAKDKTVVAYSGDDKADEFIYKFISDSKDSLDSGELFVADLVKGEWLSLDMNKSEILKNTFKSQLDVQIHVRKAARLLGATPCDRPEDVEIHPDTGDIFVTLTNNYSKKDLKNPKNNFYGEILKISHPDGDHLSRKFTHETFVLGGQESAIACPDNLAFDKKGNLWVTTDISGSMMGQWPYESFKNNGLFYVPLVGDKAGVPVQIASAPVDAELTGITFSDDYKTLFMSVQHPGENSKSLDELSSNWPEGGNNTPRSCVVQISGPLLKSLMT